MGKSKKQKREGAKEDSQSGERNQEELLKTIRGVDDFFEWFAERPQRQSLLTEHLLFHRSELMNTQALWRSKMPEELHILVSGCGNKRLSDHLHNAGFRNITNVDFLRFMDMTSTQFQIEEFDAIVDQGGLDALMEADPRSGNLYLSKVKTVLKARGKYICLTLAESHVLDLLFPHFRFGWEMSLHTIAQDTSSTNMKVQTFVVVAEKDHRPAVSDISVFLNNCFVQCHGDQDHELWEALKKERKIRTEYSYSLEDLKLGAKGSMSLFEPGRRINLIFGEPGVSDFFYNSVLLDAKQHPGRVIHQYCVFIVPKVRARDWEYTSEEGQWLIIKNLKAARLLMVLLDSSNSIYSMEHIQKELSPFVKQLAPRCIADDNTFRIPFLVANYGIKEGQIVHQVISDLNGSVVVEDVAYLDRYTYRRLIFEKTKNLVQSEACLKVQSEASGPGAASSSKREVISASMESPYHNGIIKGLLLFRRYLMSCHLCKDMEAAKAVVLGLGAGLLPLCMKKYNFAHKIEVVELDRVVLDVAREYFGFEEDELLKVHITDGTKYVKEIADVETGKVDIIVVDVDSSDTSSGLTCPDANFVDESFFSAVKKSLSEEGLFIVNLITRSSIMKDAVYSRLTKVFCNIFRINLEEDFNVVLFALDAPINKEKLSEICISNAKIAKKFDDGKSLMAKRFLDLSEVEQLK